jgi:hypothetical protein
MTRVVLALDFQQFQLASHCPLELIEQRLRGYLATRAGVAG